MVQADAPPAHKNDEVVERFSNQVAVLLKSTRRGEVTIIFGNWKANVGTG